MTILCFNEKCGKEYAIDFMYPNGRNSMNTPFWECPFCGYPNTR